MPAPYPVAKGFSHLVQKYSGATMLTNGAASAVASTALSLKTHGFVLAKVKSYSVTDMLAGKYKSVDIQTHGGRYAGIPIGSLHLSNDGPFRVRYFKHKNDKAGLVTPVMVAMDGAIDEKDFSRALKSPKIVNGLRFLKLDLPGLGEQRLQILKPQVDLEGDKVHVRSYLITAGGEPGTGFKLDILATPSLEQERFIMLKDMKVVSNDIPAPELFGPFLQELFNPLIDFGRMDRKTRAFRLQNFKIADRQVTFKGRLLLAPQAPATADH